MIVAAMLLALMQQPAPPAPASDTAAGRPCVVEIDSVGGRGQQVEVRKGENNFFAGGGVLAHCRGAGSTLSADSVAWFAGVGRFDMIGQRNPVHIRDTAIALDATTASYFLHQDRLEAHRNVVAVNRNTGSVLRGPNLTYYRAVKGVRDTLEMYASSRPKIEYRSRPDSGEPYVIVTDRVRFRGNDQMWGGGSATIDRSDITARGDSMQLDQRAGFGLLVGNPAVQGKGARPYTLTGTRIELGFKAREVRSVKARGNGVATGSDWRLTADTIDLLLDQRKLQQAFAWGRKDSTSRANAVSARYTIEADSLALDTPNEVLTEARAFGKALSRSKRDSTPTADVDWMTGDSLAAHWIQEPDSASGDRGSSESSGSRGSKRRDPHGEASGGRTKSKLHQLIAWGSARSFTHLYNQKDSTAGPSLNYSRGDKIDIALTGDKIDRVIVSGRADGVQLEPKPPAPADTTKKPETR